MKLKLVLWAFSFIPLFVTAQDTAYAGVDRSQLSIMVVPYTSGNEDIIKRLETEPGYKEAISGINSALINMGYRNTRDFKTHKENIDNGRLLTEHMVWSDRMKLYIENAPVDVLVEAEITWSDPPGHPRDRQVKMLMKAVDKYTSAVYADNASIQSGQREFPGLGVAVDHALNKEGAAGFRMFLDQLDASYRNVLKEGRHVNIRFETGTDSKVKLSDYVGDERLSDKVEECLRKAAFNGRYHLLGQSATYMEFNVQVPVIDESGASVTPSMYLRKKVDAFFHKLGYTVEYLVVGNWIHFVLGQAKPAG